MYVGGWPCVTFGHGIVPKEGDKPDARAHAFFGSYEKVLTALAFLPGFHDEDGVARCGGVLRDADGLIRDLAPLGQTAEIELSGMHAVEMTA
jgi:hypothetical protein